MKKAAAIFLAGLLMLEGSPAAGAAHAVEDAPQTPAEEMEFCCGTEPELLEELESALLWKKAAQLRVEQEIASFSGRANNQDTIMPGFQHFEDLMPSTGSVRMLVLPLLFPDCPEELEQRFSVEGTYNDFFAPYDPNLSITEQSVRGFYHQLSYGKLDITGTVLPPYQISVSVPSSELDNSTIIKMTAEALRYYCDGGLDVSQFDNDGDGRLDALYVLELRPDHPYYAGWVDTLGGVSIGGYLAGKYARSVGIGIVNRTCEHEIGHLLGLADNYKGNIISADLGELMSAPLRRRYMNVYYKYLLGWIDLIILTNEDGVGEVELFPAELLEGGQELPRAVALVPDMTFFPYCEYYIAEYRMGIGNYVFQEAPGVVIWHCNTYLAKRVDMPYRNDNSYLKPVYKSGSADMYTSDDVYVAGDEFSSDSEPSSSLYDGAYTGAYLKVEELTPEKAVLQTGFREPNLLPPPVIEISAPTKKVLRKGEKATLVITVKAGDELVPIDNQTASRLMALTTTGTVKTTGVRGSATKNPYTITINGANMVGEPGDGEIWLDIFDAAVCYNAKGSAPVTSEKICIDNTPPEISLQGANPQRIQQGTDYTELGAIASDNLDPDIEGKLEIDISQVDTAVLGSYTVTYSVTDHAGHTATAERTVIVEEKPPHVHDYSTVWSSDETSHWHECECGEKADFAPHTENAGTVTKQPTLEETGIKTYSCSTCGYEMRTETIPKLEPSHIHEYSTAWISDVAGHWHGCECGEKADFAPHTAITDPAEESTCTTPGKTEGSHCSICEYVITAQAEAPLKDHSYSETWNSDGTNHWHECGVCKEKIAQAPHTWDGGVVTTAPTSSKAGVRTYTCTVCAGTKTEAIPATGGGSSGGSSGVGGKKPSATVTPPPAPGEDTPAPPAPVEEEPPLPEDPLPAEFPFEDVRQDAWYRQAVEYAYEKGIMTGVSDRLFAPETMTSRGMVVTMLYRMEGEPTVKTQVDFTDVPAGRYYADAVAWAVENGIVTGYGDGTFRPDIGITREQLVTILYRYSDTKGYTVTQRANLSSFFDAGRISPYAREPLAWANATGLLGGTDWGGIDPGGSATRAQVAAVLMRFLALR